MRNPRAGQFASSNPRAILLAGSFSLQAWGDEGVEVGAFAWVKANSGHVENIRYNVGDPIGFVLPVSNFVTVPRLWGVIPPGYQVTLATKGDFFAVFPNGATRGQQVFASIFDGTPISGETPDAEATQWYVVNDAAPGGLAIISTWR